MTVRELQHLAEAMAHEVRNPLNSMAIHLELSEGRLKKIAAGPERDQVLKSVGVLIQEVERIDKILEEFLEFAGPPEVSRQAIAPRELIAQLTERVRRSAQAKHVELRVNVEEDGVWQVEVEAFVEALVAVLENAIEASKEGATVAIEARTEDDNALVEIADSGCGIAPEDLRRVFHIGFSTRGRSGIGLAVAKQIVKGHGGSIEARSTGAGQGARFVVRLPLENG